MPKILAVDDNEEALFALESLLVKNGYEVVTASNGKQAVDVAIRDTPDLILLDVVMPRERDHDIARAGHEATKVLKADPVLRYTPVVLLTSLDSLDDITAGFRAGADDYIRKPFQPQELLARVAASLRTREIYRQLSESRSENRELRASLGARFSFSNIIGANKRMQEVYSLVEKVANSHVPVLITGESGTGKELVAKAIHFNSDRAEGTFLAQNCSAFSEHLLESELFGHVKGSFTGALRDKMGLFQAADGGSLFLDELGEMALPLQAKLLRVVQEGTLTPVGDTRPRKVNVRIITATHRDLSRMIQEGTFREDLFYRLNVIRIHLPPLRERKDDIPLLVEHFLKLKGKAEISIHPAALQALVDCHWPGNIRQLDNEIERLLLLSGGKGEITTEFLSPEVRFTGSVGNGGEKMSGSLREAMSSLERKMIEDALKQTGGNKSEAARTLGIPRSNLITKVQEYGLESGT